METDRLRYFAVLSKTENLRRAAELLHITPSALSKSIHQLEKELDVELMVRSGRGLRITQEGRKLAERSRSILYAIENLESELKTDLREKTEAPLKIATFEVFSTYFLSTLDRSGWTDRGLSIYDTNPGELEAAVAEEKVDLGITYFPIAYPNCDFLKICKIEMGVFSLNGAFPDVKQTDLPFVVPIFPLTGTPSRIRGLDGWPEDAYERKVQYQVTLMESALELCRQGRCAAYIPVFIANIHNEKYQKKYHLVRRPSPYGARKCYSEVYIVKRNDQVESNDIKKVAKLLRMGCRVS